MLSCSLLLAAYECGNTSEAAVYDVSLTTVDITSLLPCITLVAPAIGFVSLSVCVFLCSGDNDPMLNAKSQPQ